MHLQNGFLPDKYDSDSAFPKGDWNDIRVFFKREEHIKLGFIKTLVKTIESVQGKMHTLYLCDELIDGENDYEAMRSWIEFEMDILKNLESEGYIINRHFSKKSSSRGHEDEVYVNFELTEEDAVKRLNEMLRQKQKIVEKTKVDEEKKKDIKYLVTYVGRKIILNNKYIIGSTRTESVNDRLFEYVFDNSENKITKEELKSVANVVLPPTKQLRNVVYEIGFKDEVRKTFFDCKKNFLVFHNHLTSNNLKERGVNVKKLEAQIKGLQRSSKKQ